jgi:hypothetical protein
MRIAQVREQGSCKHALHKSLPRGPDSERIRAFLFSLPVWLPDAPNRAAAWPRTAAASPARGCSLTSCRGATPVLAGLFASQFADVAQQAERDHATVEAMGSRPIIRSISGVSLHHCPAQPWERRGGMCTGSLPMCSESTWPARRPLALGHSRNGQKTSRAHRARPQRLGGSGTRHRKTHKSPGPLTQWPECLPVQEEAAGSTPARAANTCRNSSDGRALRCPCWSKAPAHSIGRVGRALRIAHVAR